MVLFLIFAGEIFYTIYFFSYFQLKEIKVVGNEKVKTEAIKNFIPSGSIFLVDPRKIKENILSSFPQIAEVKIDRKFPDKLNLLAKERKAVAMFCQEEKCFLMDKEGIIFEPIFVKPSLTEITKEDVAEVKLGEKIIDESLLTQILKISSQFQSNFSEKVAEAAIISEDRLNIKIAEGWQTYFDPREDLDWQLTKLKAVLENEISKEKRKNLEYIDLRFGNFAPYKYR